ncbi:MAG: hypothetical protein GF401_16190 [Chitinivibrionales bacterium]|nr:hypothetical protein [Chitinivibrionales bacterium]
MNQSMSFYKEHLWARMPGHHIVKRSRDIMAHLIHDPVQDRYLLDEVALIRVKRLRLGEEYKNYIIRTLRPGGTILILKCTYKWPSFSLGARSLFQVGGFGDTDIREYVDGGPRVKQFLAEENSRFHYWKMPDLKQVVAPEAEWGFDEDLDEDIGVFAERNGYNVCRLYFDHPESLSAPTADFYRAWYKERGIESRRLMADCFSQMSPSWALHTASIPYWMAFNTKRSLDG